MSNQIHSLLQAHGPCLTSDLIAQIMDSGVSYPAARQRITRGQSKYVKKLAGLRFAKNVRFIYLESQYGDARFWKALERAFSISGKAYWGAVIGLKARAGICPKSLFPVVCGAPLRRKRQLSPDQVLERLSAINLLEEVDDGAFGEPYIRFKPSNYPVQSITASKAYLLAEFIAVKEVTNWARKIGFGSYGKFLCRGDDEMPVVSGVAWDITAPSYIRPLVSAREGKLKPGFFVCDVNLREQITEEHVELFIRKYDMAASPQNVAPIIPFMIGEGFVPAAFDKAKSAGIVAVTIANLFGEDISKGLKDLIVLLTDMGATASVNPEHLDKVMSQLTRIEGAANNLRGALFELVVGNLIKDVEEGYLSTGLEKIHYLSERKVEIDVLFDMPTKESLVVECKAKIPGSQVSLEDVQRWYSDRVPLIYDVLKQEWHYIDRKLRFEIWTNGTFHAHAIAWLNQQNLEFESHSIAWRDGAMVKKVVGKAKNKSVRKIMNEHYFRNPMTKIVSTT